MTLEKPDLLSKYPFSKGGDWQDSVILASHFFFFHGSKLAARIKKGSLKGTATPA